LKVVHRLTPGSPDGTHESDGWPVTSRPLPVGEACQLHNHLLRLLSFRFSASPRSRQVIPVSDTISPGASLRHVAEARRRISVFAGKRGSVSATSHSVRHLLRGRILKRVPVVVAGMHPRSQPRLPVFRRSGRQLHTYHAARLSFSCSCARMRTRGSLGDGGAAHVGRRHRQHLVRG
jgi:hypothetical protein